MVVGRVKIERSNAEEQDRGQVHRNTRLVDIWLVILNYFNTLLKAFKHREIFVSTVPTTQKPASPARDNPDCSRERDVYDTHISSHTFIEYSTGSRCKGLNNEYGAYLRTNLNRNLHLLKHHFLSVFSHA